MKKTLIFVVMTMMMHLCINAQKTDGFFRGGNDNYENRSDVDGWNLGNQTFGDAPLGSGLLIMVTAGAGYAIARRKRSRKGIMMILAVAMILGFTQCKKNVEMITPVADDSIFITLNAGNPRHSVNTGNGQVTYQEGDVIYVGNAGKYVGTLTCGNDGKFSGTISPAPADASELHFYFVGGCTPSATLEAGTTTDFTVNISNQSSNLPVLSYEKVTYYTATSSYSCTLKNKCGLVKFVPSTATSATVTLNGVYNKATINFASPGITPTGEPGNIALYSVGESEKWAILLPQSGATATATTGGITYAIESFPNITNNYYNNTGVNISSTVVFDANTSPLTFEAMADGVTVKLHKFQTAQPSLQYRKNDGDWTTLTFVDSYYSTSISLNTGDKLSFKGDNTTLTENQNGYCKFELSGNCYVYGNIMSLLDKDNFPTNKTLSASFTFYQLFLGAPIYNHPSKTLVLPATTLTTSCYEQMFYNTPLTVAPALPATTLAIACYKNMFGSCTSLTTAPTLSATTLASECYRRMFQGCTGLTTAPNLPATTLASDCYHEMLSGCTGLTTAPTLSATTLAENCYRYMFEGCTALETAPVLPATKMATECYLAMFNGCTSLTTAPDLPATTLASNCYTSMFRKCTRLTTAPATLPATTLVDNCYRDMFDRCSELTTAPTLPATTLQPDCYKFMFYGCTKLNNVTCLATNISARDCTNNWLYGVAATGTFTKAASMTGWTSDVSGIPSGWTVNNYSAK